VELLAIFRRTKAGEAALKERTVPLTVTQRFFLNGLDGKKNLGELQQLSPRHFADMVGLVQGLSQLQLIELVMMPSTQRTPSTTQTGSAIQPGTKTGGVTSTGIRTNSGYITGERSPLKTIQSGSATTPGVYSTHPGTTRTETLASAKDALSRLVQHYYGPMAKHTVAKVQACSSLIELNLLVQQTSQTMVEAFSRMKAEAFYREAMAILPSDEGRIQ
jgi:hypothetical protein